MAEIKKINDTTWTIEDGSVRCYILLGQSEALLIDTGMTLKNIKELVAQVTDLPVKLLNTHADPDHISANEEFEEFYMNPAEAANYYKEHKKTGKMIAVEDKDIIDIGGRKLQIISFPGHTPGSIGILDIANRILFSGDPIQDGRIFMFGDRREMHAYILSLEKAYRLRNQYDLIYPSHGSYPVNADIIPDIIGAAKDILERKVTGKTVDLFGNKPVYYDFGFVSFLYDE